MSEPSNTTPEERAVREAVRKASFLAYPSDIRSAEDAARNAYRARQEEIDRKDREIERLKGLLRKAREHILFDNSCLCALRDLGPDLGAMRITVVARTERAKELVPAIDAALEGRD